MYKGRIVAIERTQFSTSCLTQGKDKYQQPYYDNSDKYFGSNGSYISDIYTDYFVELMLVQFGETKEDNIPHRIDIRDDILRVNSRKRVSKKMIDTLIADNVGRKVDFDIVGGHICFPTGQLNLIV